MEANMATGHINGAFLRRLSKCQISLQSVQDWYTVLCTGYLVRFEVFTAVTMKNGVFWDITSCGSCNNRRFAGT
jgi:hypothetical protein